MTEPRLELSLWFLGQIATENAQIVTPAYIKVLAGVLDWKALSGASLIGLTLEHACQYRVVV